jgi:hypothetical protein
MQALWFFYIRILYLQMFGYDLLCSKPSCKWTRLTCVPLFRKRGLLNLIHFPWKCGIHKLSYTEWFRREGQYFWRRLHRSLWEQNFIWTCVYLWMVTGVELFETTIAKPLWMLIRKEIVTADATIEDIHLIFLDDMFRPCVPAVVR